MMAVGVFLAPIAFVALAVVWLAYHGVLQPVASSLADPETRGGCLVVLGLIAAPGLMYYLIRSVFGIGEAGWIEAIITSAVLLAVALWCGICAWILRDPEARWGLAVILVVLCAVAAASFAHFSSNRESAWAVWVCLIAGAMAILGFAVAGVYVLARLLRSPWALAAVALAAGVAAAAIHFLDLAPEGWTGLWEAMDRWTGFAGLALAEFPALFSLAGYGGLAAVIVATVRRDAEVRLGSLILLSAIALAVPLTLLLNGWLSLWLAIPIALAVAWVVAVVVLGALSATGASLSVGVAVVGVLVALLVGFLPAGPEEDGQGTLGGAAPEPAGEAYIHIGGPR